VRWRGERQGGGQVLGLVGEEPVREQSSRSFLYQSHAFARCCCSGEYSGIAEEDLVVNIQHNVRGLDISVGEDLGDAGMPRHPRDNVSS